jgi:hypothetical protein
LRPVARDHCSHFLVPSLRFAFARNIAAAGRLALVSAIEHIGTARAKALGAAVFHQRAIGAMGLFTKDIKTMDDLLVHQLQDIYYAEKQLVKALP